MKNLVCLVTLTFTVLGMGVASADDHQELVCAGVAPAPKGGGDAMPVFIHYFESRAKDGTSRNEVLSTIYQGKLFKSSSVNKTGSPAKDAAFALKAGAATHIKGKYTLEIEGGQAWRMHIIGTYEKNDLDVALPCTDLSI